MKIASFSTARFTAKGGFVIDDISPEVGGRGFGLFLASLARRPEATYDIGMTERVSGGDLHTILAQLANQPVRKTVTVDVRKVAPLAALVDKEAGFREHWQIDNNSGGVIAGSGRADVVLARGGNDRVNGFSGDDVLSGGDGADRLSGMTGDDRLDGGAGGDALIGGTGNDILHGGAGSDTMTGGDGADTVLFDRSDFRPGLTRDVVEDFGRGDRLVDLTGDLRVIASGTIALFHARGTLIENIRTGDLVFVRDAFLRQADIADAYVPPSPGAGAGTYVRTRPPLEPRVETIVVYDDGRTKTEVVSVFLKNVAAEAVLNIEDLKVRVGDVAALAVKPGSTLGATYEGKGVFDLSAGGDRTLQPNGELRAFSFVVENRPANAVVDAADVAIIGRVAGASGPVSAKVGFELELKLVNETPYTASVELFMTNVGAHPLVDLENLEFRFTEKSLGAIKAVWGADHYADRFAVEPWAGTGSERAPLRPDETTKLFGFAFEFGASGKNVVDLGDFRLVSAFDDLLS
jgi:hypothetical protein